MAAITEWGSSTVEAIFLQQDGTMASGTWSATVPVDLRSATGTKRTILAGVVASGSFTTTPGGKSLSFSCPSNQDADLQPTTPAWQPIITVITGGATRVYVMDVPVGGTLDLHDYVPTTSAGVTIASQSIGLGVPGGAPILNGAMTALLDASGAQLDFGTVPGVVTGRVWNGSAFVTQELNIYSGGSDAVPPTGAAAGSLWVRQAT